MYLYKSLFSYIIVNFFLENIYVCALLLLCYVLFYMKYVLCVTASFMRGFSFPCLSYDSCNFIGKFYLIFLSVLYFVSCSQQAFSSLHNPIHEGAYPFLYFNFHKWNIIIQFWGLKNIILLNIAHWQRYTKR
jgi:hypothetical protein